MFFGVMVKYKLLAIDIDGTLLREDQTVPTETRQAIQQAEQAGLAVCLATGRSYMESVDAWRQLRLNRPFQPMVLVGGALVSEPDTGRTLYQKTLEKEDAFAFADALAEEGYSAMALVDVWRWGVDYYFSEGRDYKDAARRWFEQMEVKVRRVPRLADAMDMPRPLRVSAVADPKKAPALAERLKERFDGRMNIHPIFAPNYGLTIVEAFSAGADKFSAVRYVAQALQAGPGQIAAVGDDVNDLAMIRQAGLGAAMAKAPQHVGEAADHVVQGKDLGGFIRDILAGRFD